MGKVWLQVGMVLLAIALVAALGVGATRARNQARAWVYPARTLQLPAPADAGLPQAEEVELQTADGLTLRGWFIPAAEATAATPASTVIVLHGLGGNRGGMLAEAHLLHARGDNVLLFDLRGHGHSEGAFTTLGYLESDDVRAAVAYLLARADVDGERIAILGHSLGGVIALRAAARNPEIKAVIAVSAFTSVREITPQMVRLLTGRPPFPTTGALLQFMRWETGVPVGEVNALADVATLAPRPVLLIHGAEDEIVPADNSEQLLAAAGDPKELYIASGVGHGDFSAIVPEAYAAQITGFLDRHLGANDVP